MFNNDTHVMIDLETLSLSSKAVILSIGAVEFCELGILDSFYVNVDPTSCEAIGLDIDASTVMWWLKQSEKARNAFNSPAPVSIDIALRRFSDWYGFDATIPVWGNGANTDNVWLSAAYKAAKIAIPWRYTANRCYRTMIASLPRINVPDIGIAHNALDDAKYQAEKLIEAWKLLKQRR